jgi:uridine phosphorylase
MTKEIQKSELILNSDKSIYHLHLLPEDIADDIILVGDPGRVKVVASFFESIDVEKHNREFYTITGRYKGKRITALSTGIGTDNIDIVINEIDAIVNFDLDTRTEKDEKKSLNFIRIGTSGGLQHELTAGSILMTETSIGFDGLLNFYAGRDEVSDLDFENELLSYLNWNTKLTKPYIVPASEGLLNKIYDESFVKGITISSPGFYGPQGRMLRLEIVDPNINDKITAFEYNKRKITNYEMESSALYGLSKMLGHNALTVCVIIANRVNGTFLNDYKPVVKNLIKKVLDKLTE